MAISMPATRDRSRPSLKRLPCTTVETSMNVRELLLVAVDCRFHEAPMRSFDVALYLSSHSEIKFWDTTLGIDPKCFWKALNFPRL